MSAFDLETFLPYEVAVLSSRMSAAFSRHYRERYGIGVAEWRVVAHLSQEDAVSVREICRRVDLDKPKVSRAASRLEAAGYVEKRVNPNDRRLVELSLTPAGRAMIEDLAPIARSFEAELEAALGEAAPAFREAVRRLNATLAAGEGGGPERC